MGGGFYGWGMEHDKLHVEEVYSLALKFPGCAAQEKTERTVELVIPHQQPINKIPEHASLQDQLIMANFLGTIQGRLLKIDYFVRVFVKHDAWNEFGQGNYVSFPVYINQSP